MELLPLIVALIFFGLGIVGTFLPILPGAVLIWLGMLLYGVLTGFENLSAGFYVLQGLASIMVMGVDYIATAFGAKRFDGSKASIVGASLGLLVGIIFMGPIGIILGPFLGAFAGEMLTGFPPQKALRASLGALMGLLGGLVVKIAIEAAMIFWFFKAILT